MEYDPQEQVLLTNVSSFSTLAQCQPKSTWLLQSTYGEFNATHSYDDVVADLRAVYERHVNGFEEVPSQVTGYTHVCDVDSGT